MASKASIMGHPIHPMLIVFPTALFPASLLFDAIWLFTGEFLWLNLAFWTLVLGVIGTVAAAIPGLIDYFGTVQAHEGHERMKSTATRHMWNGFALLVIFLVTLGVHWYAGAWSWGTSVPEYNRTLVLGSVLLNVLGNLSVVYQGWLGGSLTYHEGVGVEAAHEGEHEPARERRGVREPGGGGAD